MSPLDIYNNRIINSRLREIDIAFLEKIEYFCTNFNDIKSMPEGLLKAIKPDYKMPKKKKKDSPQQKSATELMIAYRMNNQANDRSFGTSRTNIFDFRKFLNESNIPDTIESMTKDIAARYAEWLKKQNISVNTANQRIRALATNLKNLTTILDIDFTYPLPAKLPLLKETITGDEMEDNDIALTEEQVNTLYNLEGLTQEEAVARDMFCLQCWTGVRVSDVAKVLSSANLKEIGGETFTIFRPEKTKNSKSIRAIIPLTTLFLTAFDIVKRYLDNPPKFLASRKNDYNDLIRSICRQAKFNEHKSITVEKGKGKQTKSFKLWELMSSHKGRHTFTTSCKRRGIPEIEIIKMTGHASTVQIKKTYDNTSAEDNAQLLLNSIAPQKHGPAGARKVTTETERPVFVRTDANVEFDVTRNKNEILKAALNLQEGAMVEVKNVINAAKEQYHDELASMDEDMIELIDDILAVSIPYYNLMLTYSSINLEQALSASNPDPDYSTRWSLLEIFECLKSIPQKYASTILSKQPLSGKQFDKALFAVQEGNVNEFIHACGDLDSRHMTWLCQSVECYLDMQEQIEPIIGCFGSTDDSSLDDGVELMQHAVNMGLQFSPSLDDTAKQDIVDSADRLCNTMAELSAQNVRDQLLGFYLSSVMALIDDCRQTTDLVLKRYLKELLSREEAKPAINYHIYIENKDIVKTLDYKQLTYFAPDVVTEGNSDDFIGFLKTKIIESGDEKFKELIDYLAQYNIDSTNEIKKLLAYRITGRRRPIDLHPIKWRTRGNTDNGYDLCYMLHHISDLRGRKLIEKMKRFFYGPALPDTISQYAKSANRDFKEALHDIYPEVFPL